MLEDVISNFNISWLQSISLTPSSEAHSLVLKHLHANYTDHLHVYMDGSISMDSDSCAAAYWILSFGTLWSDCLDSLAS